MYKNIIEFIEQGLSLQKKIQKERQLLLDRLVNYISKKLLNMEDANLIFICTHNSRRSQLAQVFAVLAAEYAGLKRVRVYSGGTQITRVHPNTVATLLRAGFLVKQSGPAENPVFEFQYGNEKKLQCHSKSYDDPTNPSEHFAAVMTCSEAEQNCPVVQGSEFRLGLPYPDPGASDGEAEENTVYDQSRDLIAREMLYVFSRVKKQLHEHK